MRSPIIWYGGKGRLAQKLLRYIPDPDRYDVYVEPFGGGASLLFAKDPVGIEIYNDIDRDLVHFFKMLHEMAWSPDLLQRFRTLCELTPHSRRQYVEYKASWEQCTDDLERAYMWFVSVKQSFAGIGSAWSHSITWERRNMSGVVSTWLSTIECLDAIVARMRHVQVENMEGIDCICKYDMPRTLFYVDPPYLPGTRKSPNVYNYEMTVEEHISLLNTLVNVQGMVLLSGYPSSLYRDVLQGWSRTEFEVSCSINNTRVNQNKRPPRTEILWYNRQLANALNRQMELSI